MAVWPCKFRLGRRIGRSRGQHFCPGPVWLSADLSVFHGMAVLCHFHICVRTILVSFGFWRGNVRDLMGCLSGKQVPILDGKKEIWELSL